MEIITKKEIEMSQRYDTRELLSLALFFLDVSSAGKEYFDNAGYPGDFDEYQHMVMPLVQLANNGIPSIVQGYIDPASAELQECIDRAHALWEQIKEQSRILDIQH